MKSRLSGFVSEVGTLVSRLVSPRVLASDCPSNPSKPSAAMSSVVSFDSVDMDNLPIKKKVLATSDAAAAATKKKMVEKKVDRASDASDASDDDDEEDNATVASTLSHANGSKKSKKRKNPFGDSAAKHLCTQAGVTKKTGATLKMINQLVIDFATTIAEKAIALARQNNRITVEPRDIAAADRELFGHEVYTPPALMKAKKSAKKKSVAEPVIKKAKAQSSE